MFFGRYCNRLNAFQIFNKVDITVAKVIPVHYILKKKRDIKVRFSFAILVIKLFSSSAVINENKNYNVYYIQNQWSIYL